jgi:hypothetical protein
LIQGPGSLNLAEHQEFGAFFIANSSSERLSYLPGYWDSGSWVSRTSTSIQKKKPPPYKIANATTAQIANGMGYRVRIDDSWQVWLSPDGIVHFQGCKE